MPSSAITSDPKSASQRSVGWLSAAVGIVVAFASLNATGCKLNSGYSTGSSLPAGLVATIAGQSGTSGFVDGPGPAALFDKPRAVATDGASLYIADTFNNCIRKIALATGAVSTIAGQPGVSGSQDGTGSEALFNEPYGIAYDSSDGSLYIADTMNYTIRKLEPATCAVTTVAGEAGQHGYANGTGTSAKFSSPQGMAYDANNDCLYVADTGSCTIRKVALSGYIVTTLAGSHGVKGHDDAVGTAATFDSPSGIAVDSTGSTVYVADTSNNLIRAIIVSSATVSTVAGSASTAGYADGQGAAAQFNLPRNLACDGSILIVADSGNYTLRKIDLSTGTTSTFAGRSCCDGSADGLGSAALLSAVSGLAISADINNLQPCAYFVDTGNDTVRMALL
jgi:DNA-binding beta-propeller fold protein YncE